jgi:serine/threonine-protein kinase
MNEKSPSQLSKYRILGLVGRGQFGKVLCARMRDTGKLVALKELENKRFPTSKLLRELRFLLTLRHENIVACSSLVHHQNYRYLVMDYCEGGTLRDLMNYASALSVKQCFDLVNDILLGLEHAHAANIIHCDIKPENILLKITAQGWQAKISDFGISRLTQEIPTEGTSNTGSPGYMAPERFYGQFSVGSDIYAVGIILYEILVGKRPFTGMPMDLMNAHINQRIVFPDTLPRSLQAIITRALEKLPQRRYATAEEMRLDLLATIRAEDFSHTQTGLSAELCTTILFAQKAPHFAQLDLPEKVLSLAATNSSQFYSASLHLLRHSLPIAPELEISKVKHEFHLELQQEFHIQAITSVQKTLFVKTDHGIYQCDQNDQSKSKQIYKSVRSFEWVISPTGDWLAISTGKQLEIRNLVYGRSMRLEFSSRELSCIIAFDRHHLVAIANKPDTQESRAIVISRRGNIMYRLALPIPIDYGVATFTSDRVLLRESGNHKNIYLLDLKPYRLARIPLEYDVSIMAATSWGYAIAAKYNAKNNDDQTILILLDLSGHNISNLIIDGEVTAIAPIDMSLLAIAVSGISGHKLYAINLKKLEIDLVF